MTETVPPPERDRRLREIFSAQAVRRGGVGRQSVRWVEREIGPDALVSEVPRRGFHMPEAGGQYLIICNPGRFRIIC